MNSDKFIISITWCVVFWTKRRINYDYRFDCIWKSKL